MAQDEHHDEHGAVHRNPPVVRVDGVDAVSYSNHNVHDTNMGEDNMDLRSASPTQMDRPPSPEPTQQLVDPLVHPLPYSTKSTNYQQSTFDAVRSETTGT